MRELAPARFSVTDHELTSACESAVPDAQQPAVPVVGQPGLRLAGRAVGSHHQLRAAEGGQVVRIDARVIIPDVNLCIRRKVGNAFEGDVGHVSKSEREIRGFRAWIL